MSQVKFFDEQPDYRYAMLNWLGNARIPVTLSVYTQAPTPKLNELIKKEFHPDDAALAAYLYNTASIYRLQLIKLQQELNALKASK